MKAMKIKEDIYWVGALDWSLRNFHGYTTRRGVTYNAYLIMDEKITLIDTVEHSFTDEMLERISDLVDPAKIDYIITNHVEMDHSGSIPVLKERCPNATIITSGPSGVKGLTAHYGPYDYHPIKAGEELKIGKRTLTFVTTPMLHWPDNMVTYCPEERLLFSNDAFGQHYVTSDRFDDECSLPTALDEAKNYYGNILMCYGKQAHAAWQTVVDLNPEMIAPSHGVVWRSHVKEILESYRIWSENDPESGAVVVYDSMWHSTEAMARVIADAFMSKGITTKLFDLKYNDNSDIIPEILTSKYLAVGSSTLNNQMMPNVAAFLCYLKGLSPKNRKAVSFGSYGWGGQSIKQVEEELKLCGFELFTESIKVQYIPGKEQLKEVEDKIISALD